MSQPRTQPQVSTAGPLAMTEGTGTPSATSDSDSTGVTSPRFGASRSRTTTQKQPRDREAGPTEQTAWIAQDIVDEWGLQSFPASDPPANW